MLKLKQNGLNWLLVVVAAVLLTACSDEPQKQINTDPVAFHSADECHVCGMLITEWPGSKGQSINTQNGEVHKFCSTVDMFSWLLQPENKTLQAKIYVHDMAKTHWDQPEDEHLMDAREAWYVVGSGLIGAMGPSIASYSDRVAADQLAEKTGGRVLAFDQIGLEVLQEIARAGHEHAAEMGEMLQHQMHGGDDHARPEHDSHGEADHESEQHDDQAAGQQTEH